MPKRRNKERIVAQYFTWLLGKRRGVYTADGRSNQPPLGRHSLGTRNAEQALLALKKLDLVMAVKAGRADESVLKEDSAKDLSLNEGRKLYESHVTRPRVTGGAKPPTAKRYRAVFNKFIPFANEAGITSWNRVSKNVLEQYAAHLDDQGYAYATEYLELTTLKQTINWLIESEALPASCRIRMTLSKPRGTNTYCWQREEVCAIVGFCAARRELHWLRAVVVALSCTGLRISELGGLRRSDIDFTNNTISLTDESTKAPRRLRRKRREIKNRRSRSFPIHDDLLAVLRQIPRVGDELVFRGPRGGVIKPDTVRRVLIREVLSKLADRFPTPEGETGFLDGRLHSFRHYFCSTCANCNVPEQVVMAWLGHQSSRMVRHYYHLHDEEAQRHMKRLGSLTGSGPERPAK